MTNPPPAPPRDVTASAGLLQIAGEIARGDPFTNDEIVAAFHSAAETIRNLATQVERLTAERDELAGWREIVQTYVAEQIEADGSDPSQASSPFAAIGLIVKRTERATTLAAERDALREAAQAMCVAFGNAHQPHHDNESAGYVLNDAWVKLAGVLKRLDLAATPEPR